MKDGCVKPVRGPVVPPREQATRTVEEEAMVQARVRREAPDFEATAFLPGEGFGPVRLSDYKGRWVVLCFYPGDFTLV